MEPIWCTELLPVEMWEVILEHVVSLEDLLSCQRTCSHWESILEKRVGSILLFHKMLPSVWEHLRLRDILSCRLVCHGWRDAVDDCPLFKPTWDWKLYYDRRCEMVPRIKYVPAYYPLRKNMKYFSLDSGHQPKRPKSVKLQRGGGVVHLAHLDFSAQVSGYRFSPCHARRINYGLEIGNFSEWNQSCLDQVSFEYKYDWGKYHHLLCKTCDDRKTIISYLTLPFTTFPQLKVLHLDLEPIFKSGVEKSEVEKLEGEVLEALEELKREGKIRLNSLRELEVEGMSRWPHRRERRRVHGFPLARWISALVTSAPRLDKVTIRLRSLYYDQAENEELNMVLNGVAKARTVTQLNLQNWPDKLHDKGFGPSGQYYYRSLKCLIIRFGGFGHGRVHAPTLLRFYFGILERLGSSLEELHMRAGAIPCQPRGGCGYYPRIKTELHRRCFCNENEEWEEPKYPGWIVELGSCLKKVLLLFVKLKHLSISHAILHPAIFPVVMKTTPQLITLTINDLEWRDWIGKESPESLHRVHGLVCQLWAEAPPPSLDLIVVSKWTPTGSDYKVSRRMFENSSVSLDENDITESDRGESDLQPEQFEDLLETGAGVRKRQRNKKCCVAL